MDFFTVPTVTMKVLFVFVILEHAMPEKAIVKATGVFVTPVSPFKPTARVQQASKFSTWPIKPRGSVSCSQTR